MLSTISKRSAAMLARRMQKSSVPMIMASRALSGKSWIPDSTEKMQAVTTQALIHEVSEQQKLIAAKVYFACRSQLLFLRG